MVIDSVHMKVMLTPEKATNLAKKAWETTKKKKVTIRDLAKMIGKIIAAFQAVNFGPLHYRHLEWDKKAALELHKGDFDQRVYLSTPAEMELQWWAENAVKAYNDIKLQASEVVITSDASLTGYGSACRRPVVARRSEVPY